MGYAARESSSPSTPLHPQVTSSPPSPGWTHSIPEPWRQMESSFANGKIMPTKRMRGPCPACLSKSSAQGSLNPPDSYRVGRAKMNSSITTRRNTDQRCRYAVNPEHTAELSLRPGSLLTTKTCIYIPAAGKTLGQMTSRPPPVLPFYDARAIFFSCLSP